MSFADFRAYFCVFFDDFVLVAQMGIEETPSI